MENIRLGIVGTGMISKVIAEAAKKAEGITLYAVASRSKEKAKAFASQFQIPVALGSYEELIEHDEIDAIYLGIPTFFKEKIAVSATENGKHILVDKPFTDSVSLKRITDFAASNKVAFMDGTHFVHHPRTDIMRKAIKEHLGNVQSVNTTFFFPSPDGDNIRFDSNLEPGGPIADLAWYSMRAIIEFMPEAESIQDQVVYAKEAKQDGVLMRGAGLLRFSGQQTSAWQVGYDAGTLIMDLSIIGTEGLIQANDFTLDWELGFPFDKTGEEIGFTIRQGMAVPSQFKRIKTPSDKSAQTLMLENFGKLIRHPEQYKQFANKSLQTQQLLDQVIFKLKD